MNGFDQYRLPLGITDTVEIPLPNTGAVFHVMLPSSNNEDFAMKMVVRANQIAPIDIENEKTDMDPTEFIAMKKNLFFDTCIKEATGLPEDVSPKQFFKEYPLAARYVFGQAQKLANVADKEVQEALGNLGLLPSGAIFGGEKKKSTDSQKKEELH